MSTLSSTAWAHRQPRRCITLTRQPPARLYLLMGHLIQPNIAPPRGEWQTNILSPHVRRIDHSQEAEEDLGVHRMSSAGDDDVLTTLLSRANDS